MTVDELLDLLPDPTDERPVVIVLAGDVYEVAGVRRYEDAVVIDAANPASAA